MPTTKPKFATAMMIYMSAQNDLADYADINLGQIAKEQPLNNVLLYVMKDTKDGTYTFEPDGPTLVTDLKKADERLSPQQITDSRIFKRFLDDAATSLDDVDARQRIMIFWGHGGGIYFLDENTEKGRAAAEASIPAFADVLEAKAKSQKDGLRFNIVAFDSCYMGVIETAAEFGSMADFVLASTTAVDQAGLPYGQIMAELNSRGLNLSPRQAAVKIRDLYNGHYMELDPFARRYLFVYDLGKIGGCIRALNELGSQLSAVGDKKRIADAVRVASAYSGNEGFRDVLSLCDQLRRSFDGGHTEHRKVIAAVAKLESEVKDSVSGQGRTLGEDSSIPTAPVVWAPVDPNTFNRFAETYNQLSASDGGKAGWTKFWHEFHGAPVKATAAPTVHKFKVGLGRRR
jgi:hypothetical protein